MTTRPLTTGDRTTDYGTTEIRITGLRDYGPLTTGPRDKEKYALNRGLGRQRTTDHGQLGKLRYALRRGLGFWEVTFDGRHATFPHEQGAPYVAWLLLHPPRKPIHALTLALEARKESVGQAFEPAGSWGFPAPHAGLGDSKVAGTGRLEGLPYAADVIHQRYLGLDEAEAVRDLRRRERELEAVLEDRLAIEPVKAKALRELEAIADFMRAHPWNSRECVQKCAWAVSRAIRRLHARLAGAVDREGKPDPVLQGFARHLNEHLLIASDGGGIPGRQRVGAALPGWFIYEPPPGVVWEMLDPKSEGRRPSSEVRGQRADSEVRGQKSEVRRPISEDGRRRTEVRRPAAVGYLASFLCACVALTLLVTGCAGTRPLKGGRAVITRTPAGVVEQSLVQGENAAQATRQDQESVKVRTYTVPAGSRIEQSQVWEGERPREPKLLRTTAEIRAPEVRAREDARPPGRQPSTTFTVSAPMAVIEREETRARTELGAAQKDTARELGAKLSSLKGIVWVGVGLFVFGLASLVWPPLKAVIGSVTTSAALMLGGVALMVLPSLVVGNELLILGGVGLAVGAWFLAHRHGQLRGALSVKREA